jgi:alanyl-tRNA synthetase
MKRTELLHQYDPYLKSSQSKIVKYIINDEIPENLKLQTDEFTALLVLDKTIFFPEGGGQPSDEGHISNTNRKLEVSHVFSYEGVVYHRVKVCNEDLNNRGLFDTGETVQCDIDWEKRFLNMQRHCGEHILSAAFYELFGGVNRGFHMGSDYMTIDISLESEAKCTSITEEMVQEAEWVSNKYIWDNLPITTLRFKSAEDTNDQPMRKSLDLDEDIAIVCVGDTSWAAGCVACCGTHPKTTGEVGLVKVYRWENYKGMTRITFDAGANAFTNFKENAEIIKHLSTLYSSEQRSLIDNIKKRDKQFSEKRQEHYEIKQAYLSLLANEVIELPKGKSSVIIKKYDILKTSDLLDMSKSFSEIPSKLLALVSLKENTLILLSNGSPDCNKIIKDNAAIWNGKGGGRPASARAMFPSLEDLDCFLEYLYKAY